MTVGRNPRSMLVNGQAAISRASTERRAAVSARANITLSVWITCAQYNKSYNYFSGMKDEEVSAFQSDARSGHRPTWKMGENASAKGKAKAHAEAQAKKASSRSFDPLMGRVDPFGLFGEMGPEAEGGRRKRPVRNAERKALSALGLDETATANEVKAKYKALVKKHHPDANGGSRDSEDRFREIVQAYDYLKSADFC